MGMYFVSELGRGKDWITVRAVSTSQVFQMDGWMDG
jgi:hypothetical protein